MDPRVRSGENLERAYVVPLVPHNAPIDLRDPDPRWPDLFVLERDRIRGALGDTALVIEHVGSTSVPGLAAKPIIDIALAVADSASEEDYVPLLTSAGYVLRIREPDWFEHRLLKITNPDVNLHVFSTDCVEIHRMLLFRDWLRSHDDDRSLYARTKRDLAQRTWRHVQHYADAKTSVVAEIMGRAQTAQTG